MSIFIITTKIKNPPSGRWKVNYMIYFAIVLVIFSVCVLVYSTIKDRKKAKAYQEQKAKFTYPTFLEYQQSNLKNNRTPPVNNDELQKKLFDELSLKVRNNIDDLIEGHEYDLNNVCNSLKLFFFIELSVFFKNRTLEESDTSDELTFAYTIELMSMSLKDIIEKKDSRFCQYEYLTEKNYDEKLVDLYVYLLNERLATGLITEDDYNVSLDEVITSNEILSLDKNYKALIEEGRLHLSEISDEILRGRLDIRFRKELSNFKKHYTMKIVSLEDSFSIYGFTLSLLKSSIESILETINQFKRPESKEHTEQLVSFYKRILEKEFLDKFIDSAEFREDVEKITPYIEM